MCQLALEISIAFINSQTKIFQGEMEIQGSFDEVSRTPLFAELLQDEDEDLTAAKQIKTQRSISVRVSLKNFN